MLVAEWAVRNPRRMVGSAIGVAGGGFLFPLYLLLNRWMFQSWLPISGAAKQLRFHHWPCWRVFASVLFVHSVPLLVLVWCSIAAMGLAVWTLDWRTLGWSTTRDARQCIALALAVFPLVHLLTLSVLSDWVLWPWYFYPFLLADVGCAMLLLPRMTVRQEVRVKQFAWVPWVALLILCAASGRLSATSRAVYQQNVALAAFIRQHPGVYAMGDASGQLAYMTQAPFVQLEGLMEDRVFLQAIRNQEPLASVMQQYGARFYISGEYPQTADCFPVAEPAQAGPDSPHLKAIVCGRDALFQVGLPKHQIYPLAAVRPARP